MYKIFTNYDEGIISKGKNGKPLIWFNEDDRGKTSVKIEKGEIWVIPTNENYYIIKLILNEKEEEEKKVYFNDSEEKLWADIEFEVDDMLSKLGY